MVAVGTTLCSRSPAAGAAGAKAAVRCWRCGEVFAIPTHTEGGRCPSCRAPYRRERGAGIMKVHCVGSGPDACSFVVHSPDNDTLVYTGGLSDPRREIIRYLKKIGIEEIHVLVGADASDTCMRTLTEILREFRVGRLFDPGFKNDNGAYGDFLAAIRKRGAAYHVVRGMENVSCDSVRCYIVRPASFAAGAPESGCLALCLVHGRNSFLISSTLQGRCVPPALASFPDAGATNLILDGSAASLKAAAASSLAPGPIVIESDGRVMGVRSLGRIAVAPSLERNAVGKGSAGGKRNGSRDAKGAAGKAPPGEKININKATAAELEQLSGIGAKKAEMIVEFREAHGAFRNIEEIKNVPGIGEKLFQRNKCRISVN